MSTADVVVVAVLAAVFVACLVVDWWFRSREP